MGGMERVIGWERQEGDMDGEETEAEGGRQGEGKVLKRDRRPPGHGSGEEACS